MSLSNSQILLKLQEALLGKITPNLRCAILQLTPEQPILNMIYDHKPTTLEQTLVAEISQYLQIQAPPMPKLEVKMMSCPLPNIPKTYFSIDLSNPNVSCLFNRFERF